MDGSIQLFGVRGFRLEFNSNIFDIYWMFFFICKEFIQFFDLIFIGFRFFILVKEEYLLKNIKFFVNECQFLESDINCCLYLIFIIY